MRMNEEEEDLNEEEESFVIGIKSGGGLRPCYYYMGIAAISLR